MIAGGVLMIKRADNIHDYYIMLLFSVKMV